MNGEVFEVKRKGVGDTRDHYAVKSVQKNKVKKHMLDGLRDEIKILKQVCYQCSLRFLIVQCTETIQS